MTLDTTEIVVQTLRDQASKLDELVDAAKTAVAHRQGTRDVVPQIEAKLKGITPQAETEIMADEELDEESRVRALRHVARAMMRVAQALKGAHDNQQNELFMAQGRATAYDAQAKSLRKQAEIRLAQQRATAESIAKGEENKAAKVKAKPNGANGTPKRKRKSRAKPKAGADAN